MKLKTIIVDDEKNALEVLSFHLQKLCQNSVEIIGSFSDSRAAIEAILIEEPDLVILDIEMPYKNGFDVIEATKELAIKYIFTTAYNQFAIKAFKVSAVDYLLKPIDSLELQSAIVRIVKSRDQKNDQGIQNLLQAFKGEHIGSEKKQIGLSVGDTLQFFNPDEIIRFESESNYTHIFLISGKKITCTKTLKDINEKLRDLHFFRAHHSHLINLHHIQKYIKGNAGFVLMKDGSTVTLSRQKKEEFLQLFWKI